MCSVYGLLHASSSRQSGGVTPPTSPLACSRACSSSFGRYWLTLTLNLKPIDAVATFGSLWEEWYAMLRPQL